MEQQVRTAELVGALSLATDLGTGQPLEHALRTAVLAVRLGELADASPEVLADTYYVALLHGSGCTSNSHEATQLFGEDIMHRAAFFLIDPADPEQVLAFYRTHVGPGRPTEVREKMIEAALSSPERARESFAAMCEVAQRFARWLRLSAGVVAALEYVFARWDAKGPSGGVGGDDLPLPARLLHVARDYSLFLSAAGADDARTVLERRADTAYDPRLAELAARHFDEVCAGLDDSRMWQHALDSEPFPQVRLSGDEIDAGFSAFAALTGLKSPWFREHSTRVADLAEAAAWRLGLSADSVAFLRRAALAADLGRVSNAVWEKPGPLGFGDRERARLHTHFTERAFAQSSALAPIGVLAGSHHERLDGSGYHRGLRAGALDKAARILAAADCYTAMRAARPYRPPLEPDEAEAELRREVDEGRLEAEAVDAVLAAAGHRVPKRPSELPAGLTRRELEVLLALVLGHSNQTIADELGISAKTVGHHVERVYRKAGVRSRAAATVWAFEHDLVHGSTA
jgi:HD-GYP domain-containing protein (c-di-GMP phosphodiesterase class II)